MNSELEDQIEPVILTPELIGRSFVQRDCLELLQSWRDGQFVLVVNRSLLLCYLKLLKALGLPPEQIRRWLWWFTSSEKVRYVEMEATGNQSGSEICNRLLQTSAAETIICSDEYFESLGHQPENWRAVSGYLKRR